MTLLATKIVLDTKTGSAYDDSIASKYHFPNRYLRPLQAALGNWAVFRRPRDSGEGIAYFGVGRIAEIVPDETSSGYYYALIEDYLPFPTIVSWKPNGRYAERALRDLEDASQVGIFLRGRSVRPLDDVDFALIVDEGMRELHEPHNARRWWTGGIPAEDLEIDDVNKRERRLVNRTVRDASFRKLVCDAYDDRCAVTRLRIINGGGQSEVQAAHVKPISEGGPDLVQNGLALSATAHWLFDRHLISIDPGFRLLVSHNRVPSEFRALLEPAVSQIHLPTDERLYPSERFLAYHRNRFSSSA